MATCRYLLRIMKTLSKGRNAIRIPPLGYQADVQGQTDLMKGINSLDRDRVEESLTRFLYFYFYRIRGWKSGKNMCMRWFRTFKSFDTQGDGRRHTAGTSTSRLGPRLNNQYDHSYQNDDECKFDFYYMWKKYGSNLFDSDPKDDQWVYVDKSCENETAQALNMVDEEEIVVISD